MLTCHPLEFIKQVLSSLPLTVVWCGAASCCTFGVRCGAVQCKVYKVRYAGGPVQRSPTTITTWLRPNHSRTVLPLRAAGIVVNYYQTTAHRNRDKTQTHTHILHLSRPSQAVQVLCKPNRAHPEAREARIAATTLAASCCVCAHYITLSVMSNGTKPRDGGPTVRFNGQTRRSSLHISKKNVPAVTGLCNLKTAATQCCCDCVVYSIE